MAQRMPLPLTLSCFSKIQVGFTFLVPAHPGSPGQRAIKRVCVCCSSNAGVHKLKNIFCHVLSTKVCLYLCSLVNSLTQDKTVSSGSYGEKITDGIDITTWVVKHNDESISFSVWDFAGQTVYYNTHQVNLLHVNVATTYS